MAVIHNTTMDRYLKIHLYEDSKSREWIKYILEYGTTEKGCHVSADRLSDSELYFDAYIDPEIPSFVEGLYGLLAQKLQTLVLRPVDEGDFVLTIQAVEDHLFSAVLSSDCFDHKIGQLVTHSLLFNGTDIERFAVQLSDEYAALINKRT